MSDAQNPKNKKFWFLLSIFINVGFLGVFKYFNFFSESFSDLLSKLGFQVNTFSIKLILPVGISFYTFHGLSYVIDIYKNRIKPERNFIDYAVFVSFFPLLVAGPIERATHLLPQIKKNRVFNYEQSVDALKLILWGFFKKMVIADSCAPIVNEIFNSYHTQDSFSLIIGAVFFAFQIYGDFSGYSDIAIGCGKLLGIELMKNFNYPYFSRDIAEFWRRWHISLNTWFRDYIYIPLGGSKSNDKIAIRNTFIIFTISGFWHGANWTFIVWGIFHAILFVPLLILKQNRKHLDIIAANTILPNIKEFISMIFTFILVCIGWIFFRSNTLSEAVGYINKMILNGSFDFNKKFITPLILISIMLLIEWYGRKYNHPLLAYNSKFAKYSMYYFLFILIMYSISAIEPSDFIYFAF